MDAKEPFFIYRYFCGHPLENPNAAFPIGSSDDLEPAKVLKRVQVSVIPVA